jgi:sialic acid synthase SpsE
VTLSGIEPVTFLPVVHCLNHYTTGYSYMEVTTCRCKLAVIFVVRNNLSDHIFVITKEVSKLSILSGDTAKPTILKISNILIRY